MKHEESLHTAICDFIRLQYPDLIFTSEPSGLRLPIGQAKKLKRLRSGTKLPDLWILEPRNGYHGLFLEIKVQDPINTKGNFRNPHIAEQAGIIKRLHDKGYKAKFVWTLDQAIEDINDYMT